VGLGSNAFGRSSLSGFEPSQLNQNYSDKSNKKDWPGSFSNATTKAIDTKATDKLAKKVHAA